MVKELLKDGFNPILFCRFIPTAEYVAAELRQALPKKVGVMAVVGVWRRAPGNGATTSCTACVDE